MKFRSIVFVIACVLLVQPFVLAQASPAGAQSQGATLYQRLGGYDALAAVTDDFIGRLIGDPQLTRFFAGSAMIPRSASGSTLWIFCVWPPAVPANIRAAT